MRNSIQRRANERRNLLAFLSPSAPTERSQSLPPLRRRIQARRDPLAPAPARPPKGRRDFDKREHSRPRDTPRRFPASTGPDEICRKKHRASGREVRDVGEKIDTEEGQRAKKLTRIFVPVRSDGEESVVATFEEKNSSKEK